jgi:hypothetical protein
MSASYTNTDSPEAAIAGIPTCALDEAGRDAQRDRYLRLATTVAHLDRSPEAIEVEFTEQLDRATLQRAIAVERECCPFFVFELDEPRRRLCITVREERERPALEALAAAFATSDRVRGCCSSRQ